jgi:hypothetical protein
MAGFKPGTSPPPVRIPILINLLLQFVINQVVPLLARSTQAHG